MSQNASNRRADPPGSPALMRGGVTNPAHRTIAGRLVIATHNPGKLREMRELLAPYGIDAVAAGDLGLDEPDETGTSFRDNAAHQGGRRRNGVRPAGVRG